MRKNRFHAATMFHSLLSVGPFLLVLFARCGCNEIQIIVVGESSEELDKVGLTCRTLPSSGYACRDAVNKTMFYHDPHTKKCTPFTFLGCGGNSNKFDRRHQCERFCRVRPEGRCGEVKDEGNCRALLPRFYFDWETWQCLSFSYGGCEGNDNNFKTREECQRICKH
ncbi:carboxypeptidase inhibitor SmCI-like [Ornithodoros turicata]|uniref:carboxypeptidase inhibitor SmCI-like n=1 Tax=Ornithodoros turicata TaxID=34597 RepID=UPI003139D191